MILIVEFPWPSASLSPNGRLHWTQKASAVKKARSDAYLLTMQALRVYPLLHGYVGPLALVLEFAPPDRRLADLDGMLSRQKYALDGMADALKVNDHQFNPITIVRLAPQKPGLVRVTVSPASGSV